MTLVVVTEYCTGSVRGYKSLEVMCKNEKLDLEIVKGLDFPICLSIIKIDKVKIIE